jgi:hypothetical protein
MIGFSSSARGLLGVCQMVNAPLVTAPSAVHGTAASRSRVLFRPVKVLLILGPEFEINSAIAKT